MSTRVSLRGVRLSFPHLFQARAVQAGDEPKFGASFLVPKNHPDMPAVLAAVEAEKAGKWGANVPPAVRSVVYDGDNDPKYSKVAGNHGHYIINSSSSQSQQPTLVDLNLQKVIDQSVFYPGCYVNVDLGFYGYDKGVSKGIACGLNGVQFVQDGERLDSRPSAEDMFGAPPGAPPAIAGGIAPPAPPVGAQVAPATVAPQPTGVPFAGVPGFL